MRKQDSKRVDEIYKKLTGRNARPSEWSIGATPSRKRSSTRRRGL